MQMSYLHSTDGRAAKTQHKQPETQRITTNGLGRRPVLGTKCCGWLITRRSPAIEWVSFAPPKAFPCPLGSPWVSGVYICWARVWRYRIAFVSAAGTQESSCERQGRRALTLQPNISHKHLGRPCTDTIIDHKYIGKKNNPSTPNNSNWSGIHERGPFLESVASYTYDTQVYTHTLLRFIKSPAGLGFLSRP